MVAFSPEFQGGKFSMAVLEMNAVQTGPTSQEGFCVAGLENVSMRGAL
jgi:hypothetical protein